MRAIVSYEVDTEFKADKLQEIIERHIYTIPYEYGQIRLRGGVQVSIEPKKKDRS